MDNITNPLYRLEDKFVDKLKNAFTFTMDGNSLINKSLEDVLIINNIDPDQKLTGSSINILTKTFLRKFIKEMYTKTSEAVASFLEEGNVLEKSLLKTSLSKALNELQGFEDLYTVHDFDMWVNILYLRHRRGVKTFEDVGIKKKKVSEIKNANKQIFKGMKFPNTISSIVFLYKNKGDYGQSSQPDPYSVKEYLLALLDYKDERMGFIEKNISRMPLELRDDRAIWISSEPGDDSLDYKQAIMKLKEMKVPIDFIYDVFVRGWINMNSDELFVRFDHHDYDNNKQRSRLKPKLLYLSDLERLKELYTEAKNKGSYP